MQQNQNTVIPFPSTRELCHWCADYKNDVETLVLSQRGRDKFGRPTLTVCHHCIESWRWYARDAVNRPKTRFRGKP